MIALNEFGPEKAGVGGSTPSLATSSPLFAGAYKNLIVKECRSDESLHAVHRHRKTLRCQRDGVRKSAAPRRLVSAVGFEGRPRRRALLSMSSSNRRTGDATPSRCVERQTIGAKVPASPFRKGGLGFWTGIARVSRNTGACDGRDDLIANGQRQWHDAAMTVKTLNVSYVVDRSGLLGDDGD